MVSDFSKFLFKNRRWLIAGSIALNLFLIGLATGPVMTTSAHTPMPGRPGGNLINHLAQNLPAEDAAKLRAIYEARRDQEETERKAFRSATEALRDVLEADPLDRDKLEVVLEALGKAGAQMHQEMTDIIRQAAPLLSAEGRKRLIAHEPRFEPGMNGADRPPHDGHQFGDRPPPFGEQGHPPMPPLDDRRD